MQISSSRILNKTFLMSLSLIVAGSLLATAFAPLSLWPFAILSPAYLLVFWQQPATTPTPRAAFLSGLLFGLGFFGLGVPWVFVSIHHFGNTDAPLAALITVLFILVLASFLGAQGYCLKRFFKGSPTLGALIGFPTLWVLFEGLRATLFCGFPWLFLGYSQLSTPLKGLAPIGSVYLVSFGVAISAGALVLIVNKISTYFKTYFKHSKYETASTVLHKEFSSYRRVFSAIFSAIPCFVFLVLIWGTCALLEKHSFTTPLDRETTVHLVQGNIPPLDKFTQADPLHSARQVYEKLSAPYFGNSLIIWPENAITYPLPYVAPYLNELKKKAIATKSSLISGIQTRIDQDEYYNSLIVLGDDTVDGDIVDKNIVDTNTLGDNVNLISSQIYHKRHLVPFGEYLPFESLLRGLIQFFDIPMSSFVPGPEAQAVLHAQGHYIAPLICYEIAFPELARETVQEADTLLTISEDGWFGDSWGPHQHLDIARMRALELGRPVLRATTSGISAIIDANGSLQSVSKQFEALVLSSTFQGSVGKTPWQHIGQLPFFILFGLMFILPGRFRKMRHHQTPSSVSSRDATPSVP